MGKLRGFYALFLAIAVLCLNTLAVHATDNHRKKDQRVSISFNQGDQHDVVSTQSFAQIFADYFILPESYQSKKRPFVRKTKYVYNGRKDKTSRINIITYSNLSDIPPLVNIDVPYPNTDLAISNDLEDPHLENVRSTI